MDTDFLLWRPNNEGDEFTFSEIVGWRRACEAQRGTVCWAALRLAQPTHGAPRRLGKAQRAQHLQGQRRR